MFIFSNGEKIVWTKLLGVTSSFNEVETEVKKPDKQTSFTLDTAKKVHK